MPYPDDLRYTDQHEWVKVTGSTARVGITSYAQEALGDIVFVSLPELGAKLSAGQPLGEVESTKSVSDVYLPVSGTVIARNDALDATPELINADPYGEGWIVEVEMSDPSQAQGLLDAADYEAGLADH
jgi:glycine cleavage system H protein